MHRTRRYRPSPSMAVALLALFIALGGTGYAVKRINGKMITNRSITGTKLKKNTVRGTEIRESRLGEVPTAANADRAANAASATNASNADTLDGIDSSRFQQAGAGAGGALTGTYPSPSLALGSVGTSNFATLPAARLSKSAVQSIPDAIVTDVS